MFCIYELSYKNYHYIGSTKDFKKRFYKHKSFCFSKNLKEYNYKVYKKFRELGLKKENFYKEVKHNILVCEIFKWECKIIENSFIDLEDEYCLNNQKENQNAWNEDGSHNKEYDKKHNKKNYEKNKNTFHCDVCDKSFAKKYNLTAHYKSKKHLKN